mgnify:FL=1|tara:strand:+ start:123 stop:1100 length:978 start_codon:yes stop_codon:yes gene_type:complete
MRVGLQITKNKQKYETLKSLIDISKFPKISFIYIDSEDSLKKELQNLDILVTYRITSKLFKYRSEKLKWIHIGASGVEQNLFDDLLKSRVMLTNAKGINSLPVAEYIISQILYFAKQVDSCNQFKKDRIWKQWELAKSTVQLSKSTLGIIGYGEIGKELSRLAKAFGMKVLATRRLQKKIEHKRNVDILYPTSEIDSILKDSDFLVLTCPLTPLTKNMINKESFKKMKKSSYLINTSRGDIVVEEDLIKALSKNQIAGAALDVFSLEPLDKKNPLFNLNNVFLSPHISGNFSNYQHIMIEQFSTMLNKFMNNKTLKNRVCKKRLY